RFIDLPEPRLVLPDPDFLRRHASCLPESAAPRSSRSTVREVGPKLIEALATNESLHRRCGHLIREHSDVSIRPHRFRDSKCRPRPHPPPLSNKNTDKAD